MTKEQIETYVEKMEWEIARLQAWAQHITVLLEQVDTAAAQRPLAQIEVPAHAEYRS